jgi:hypothetical protein
MNTLLKTLKERAEAYRKRKAEDAKSKTEEKTGLPEGIPNFNKSPKVKGVPGEFKSKSQRLK